MWFCEEGDLIDSAKKRELMRRLLDESAKRITPSPKNVLLLPPDITRYHSGAGELTNMLYHMLAPSCRVDVMPTLGQHVPHTAEITG